jgi:hypothetical protein
MRIDAQAEMRFRGLNDPAPSARQSLIDVS